MIPAPQPPEPPGEKAAARRIAAAAFLRALATASMGVLLASLLLARGFDASEIGGVASAGLAGSALVSLVATWRADRLGRRRFQVAVAILSAGGGAALAFAASPPVAAIAALLGMVSAMGRDRGPGLLLDQSMLAAAVPAAGRTRLIATYNIVQDAGHAIGALAAAVPSLAASSLGIDPLRSLRIALVGYAAAMLATAFLYAGLPATIEAPGAARAAAAISPASRRVLTRICALFAVDSLAGGFLTATLLAYFFFERFDASPAMVAALFFGARVANAASHAGAAWLAGRIGLVNTMVFTHIPSSLLLVTVPFAPNFAVAAALFLLREGLVEMDVPTRQSYVLAVVKPEERTFASGATLLVRTASWAVAPAFAGSLMSSTSLSAPLYLCAALKIAYDVALWLSFRGLRPPEEMPSEPIGAGD